MGRMSPSACYVKESLVPLGQKLDGWLFLRPTRQYDGLAVKSLNRVLERRAIAFFENVVADLDDSIWSHGKEESIKGRMVQSA